MGWGPFVESWLSRVFADDPDGRAFHSELVQKYVVPVLAHKALTCKEPVPITDFNGVISLCGLYETLHTRENGCDPSAEATYRAVCEKWFVFALIWSIGIAVDEAGHGGAVGGLCCE